jgi:hypothetical protein
MVNAIAHGRDREAGDLVVDGIARRATIEQLFLRTHFLDRFASGNLNRQQIEVLDAWIWEWVADFTGSPRYPGGVVMRVDLDSDHGLRFGRRKDEGPALYLRLGPLEERRRAVIRELHRGRVVPPKGRAANIRMESHVVVLINLRTVFAGGAVAGYPRPARSATKPIQVEVVVGLKEIARELADARAPALSLEFVADSKPAARRAAAPSLVQEKERRLLTLKDASSTGFLLEASVKDARSIGQYELVGLRLARGQPLVLGRVERRVDEIGRGMQIGVQALSDDAWPVRVARLKGADGKLAEFVFVPGPDSSGLFDSFAVPFDAWKQGALYRMSAGGDEFTIALNRVHRRGHDWALAGFEIVARKKA